MLIFFRIFLLFCCLFGGIGSGYASPASQDATHSEEVQPLIAHRGCWSDDSLPQNSIASFRKALQQNIYGTEFDVHQTLDGKLVVNHDDTFYGMKIASTTYADLCARTLPNGETIPLLEHFLRTYCELRPSVLMILELKTCSVDAVVRLIEQYNVLPRCLFISFSQQYCLELVDKGLGPVTAYLNADLTPQQLKDAGIGGINYHFSHYQSHPTWIPEARALGLWTGTWTVNDSAIKQSFLADGVIVTTDNVFSL